MEWGDVYWGDGPEYWDDSALRVQVSNSNYEFTDWTSQDWGYRLPSQSTNPAAGTGQVFTEQLALTMKSAQSTVLKRSNFKLADSPDQKTFGGWNVMVNPVGNIQDITLESDGTPTNKKFFFRRGSFNMIMNEWDGEWIEASFGPPSSTSTSFKMAGGSNLNGPGNTLAGALSSGSNTSAQPRLSLLRSTENVVGGTAISSITIQVNRGELIDGETDFLLNVDYRIMTGDKVWMVYDNGTKYELTVTADVANNSTSLSFTEFTPEYSSPTPPLIQIPMLKVWENMNRKTSGSIAGFVVTADDLTKDGISIDGFLDSDTMTGASATTIPTSESVKAYVDNSHPAEDQTLQEVTDNGNTTTNDIIGASLTLGDGTTSEFAKAFFQDGTYTQMFGYGLEMSRVTSYIRSTIADTNELRIGNSNRNWTNINQYASNHIFYFGTSERMRLTSAGNLGIGTTAPSSILELAAATPILTIVADDNTVAHGIEWKHGTTIDSFIKQLPSSGAFEFNVGRNSTWGGDFKFVTDTYNSYLITRDLHRWFILGAEKMRITSAGNVGIGTTAPTDLLHIADTSSSNALVTMRAQNNLGYAEFGTQSGYSRILSGGYLLYAGSYGATYFYVNASTAMTLNSTGLGIGTTSPLAPLDVNGNIYSSGNVLVDNIYSRSGSSDLNLEARSGYGVNIKQLSGNSIAYFDYDTTNVGIGTTSPAQKLHIKGAGGTGIKTMLLIQQDDDGAGHPGADISLESSGWGEAYLKIGGNYSIGASGGNLVTNSTSSSSSLVFKSYNAERMRITSAGNVGIGTTSPGVNLQIGDGTINTSTRFYHSDGTYMQANGYGLRFERSENFIRPNSTNNKILNIGTANYKFQISNYNANSHIFSDGSAERMRINSTGNVGIGTASPTQKLHIVGNTFIDGGLKINAANIDFTGLGTTDPAVAGRLWNNEGTLKISSGE